MFAEFFKGKTKLKVAVLNVISVVLIMVFKEKLGMTEESALQISALLTGIFAAVIIGHTATDAAANFGAKAAASLEEKPDPEVKP